MSLKIQSFKCSYPRRRREIDFLSVINGYRPYVTRPGNGRYIGEWKNNKMDGFGAIFQKNNLIYDGKWKNGKREGIGSVRKVESNGTVNRIYIGEWQNNVKHGEGKKYFKEGIYYGWWEDNQRSGLGIMWYYNGALYLGQWSEDKYNGVGVLYLLNGNRYEGFFKNGLKHGEGIFYHNGTGQIQKGVWATGVCKTSIMMDEFRNNALNPTEYTIRKNELLDPIFVISESFRPYMPFYRDPTNSFEGLDCTQILAKIKRKLRRPPQRS